ncbi:hypothetical protein [Lactiplantibacillus plajomi]|uniref:Uncharacterized protein n=1 Tax=Lactiplantibacillus plajomi TaxID=1457217 RepID=A0ABV6K2U5_9LACO|nr:hypothetical protein [Lactiplantibacillus plajomi]
MEPVVFLVTSLADVRKDRFGEKLHDLLDQGVAVKIIFADLDLLERAEFDHIIETLTARYDQAVTVESLYALFRLEKGAQLSANALVALAPGLQTKRVQLADGSYYVRYLKDDQIMSNDYYLKDGRHYYQVFYQNSQRQQVIFYGGQQRPRTVRNYRDDQAVETLLLNHAGELVYRFLHKRVMSQRRYNVSPASQLQLTKTIVPVTPGQQRKKKVDPQRTLTIVDEPITETAVIDYVNSRQFDGLYDFYGYVLTRFGSQQRLYVSLADTVALTTELPNQLIFNY